MEVWNDEGWREGTVTRWFREMTFNMASRRKPKASEQWQNDLQDLHRQCDQLLRRMEQSR